MLLRRYHKKEETLPEVIDEVFFDEDNILEDLTVKELREMARKEDIEGYSKMKKDDLIEALKG